ncbi:Restriction endonuclease-like protein [Methanonatronarchaeum thermophilum]|uniref:Restriction endonuclease-like protein n=1 Tax=Methanonatronarchaeum thermophilum TaxID=1927129 RepID=A0A1Y3GH60_9EURY|nr:hypothetical protein [Methanonatronarchaeum thermophilum]OUJ18775.1 Restriction endonuclease-like protein [Methanonatronarchaeum thermophilum]
MKGNSDFKFVAGSQDNVYWFLRHLVASRYGNYARHEEAQLRRISDGLKGLLRDEAKIEDMCSVIEDGLMDPVPSRYGGDISKRYRQTEDLVERLLRRINNKSDVRDFILAINAVINTTALQNDVKKFCSDEVVSIIDETLDVGSCESLDPSLAYDALYNVDVGGEETQLSEQREALVKYIINLRGKLGKKYDFEEDEVIRIVTAISQEYERRAGQSRSSTAGNVLETGLQHLLERFGLESTGKTEHMGDLEIDNKIEGPEGSIGFSCKRSLRERFRQSLSRQSEIGVDQIWFVALMMADLSKEKIKQIGDDGGRIYVPRDSYVWELYGDQVELEEVLYPADRFLEDIASYTGMKLDREPPD